jgi:hypothetical protein
VDPGDIRPPQLADPVALALISPPLALSTKTEELVTFEPHCLTEIATKKPRAFREVFYPILVVPEVTHHLLP